MTYDQLLEIRVLREAHDLSLNDVLAIADASAGRPLSRITDLTEDEADELIERLLVLTLEGVVSESSVMQEAHWLN